MNRVEMKNQKAIRKEGLFDMAKRMHKEYQEEGDLLNLKDIAIAIGATKEGHNIWSTIYDKHHEVLEAATA